MSTSPASPADGRLLRWHNHGRDHLLVCLHHAGGGAASFAAWPRQLADCTDLATTLNAERVQTLFAADRTLAPQLGLMPLSGAQIKARNAAYDADRQRLLELVGVLEQKQLRIGRLDRKSVV